MAETATTLDTLTASLWQPTIPASPLFWRPEPPITSAHPGAGSVRWNPFKGLYDTPEWRIKNP